MCFSNLFSNNNALWLILIILVLVCCFSGSGTCEDNCGGCSNCC